MVYTDFTMLSGEGVSELTIPEIDLPAFVGRLREVHRRIALGPPMSREQMGEPGHAKSQAPFTWEKVADRVERIYGSGRAEKEIGRQPAGALA